MLAILLPFLLLALSPVIPDRWWPLLVLLCVSLLLNEFLQRNYLL